MAIKLKDPKSESEIPLDIVEYFYEEGTQYFRVRNSNNYGIIVNYIPTSTGSWDIERFELYLLENPYLNAENDVFEVYEKSIEDERLGWIFPITILESNNNDFENHKNLNKYKFIAYQKLLMLDVTVQLKGNMDDVYRLSEIFNETAVCILSKDTIAKISDYNFNNYLLSFYNYGYLIRHQSLIAKPIYDKTFFIHEMRTNRSRVNLEAAKYDITKSDFTRSLFIEHLLQSESYLVRFIFLFQILESFMQSEFDKQFNGFLEGYQRKHLGKNDLKESIINASKERELIRQVLKPIKITQKLQEEFIQECNYLFSDLALESKSSTLSDKIYDTRNLITHRLRELTKKTDTLIKITEIFERVMGEILINFRLE